MYPTELQVIPSGRISRSVSPRTIPVPEGDTVNGHVNGDATEAAKPEQPRPRLKKSHTYDCSRPQLSRISVSGRGRTLHRGSRVKVGYTDAVSALDPRPLEVLHSERSYLMHDLQKQDQRARILLQKYAEQEVLLSKAKTPPAQKKIKSKMTALTNKFSESTQQKQLLIMRLGEIHIELQNRDLWMQVHSSGFAPHQFLPIMQQFPPTALAGYHPNEIQGYGPNDYVETPSTIASPDYLSCASHLDPTSPSFTPKGPVEFSEDIWARHSPTAADVTPKQTKNRRWSTLEESDDDPRSISPISEPQDAEEEPAVATSEEAVATPEQSPAAAVSPSRQHQEVRFNEETTSVEVVNMNDSRWQSDEENDDEAGNGDGLNNGWKTKIRRSLHLPMGVKARDKRMSLPSLKDLWPRSRKNSLAT
ncbi:hypothetical protein QBC35DRAFT_424866 [Podospora australis]|uniref:Uncharacterized protein n=1 Tax=Podospora australis TaxID=1536484 RepID=A0AAN6X258_9PEZI|nr:hypothetical protein QBC35DRAFT_424866 [Podospora australis]